jgi:hypothetical protein
MGIAASQSADPPIDVPILEAQLLDGASLECFLHLCFRIATMVVGVWRVDNIDDNSLERED